MHEANWPENEVQLCTLLCIKTGGCSEDCGYCAQSARYNTGVKAERLMEKDAVMERARAARDNGSTRFCMGAAWKGVRGGTQRFEQVLDIVRDVSHARHGSLRHARRTRPRRSARAQGSRRHRLQSQHRHLARALPEHRHHPHLRGPPPHHPPRAGRRHVASAAAASSASARPSTTGCKCSKSSATSIPQPESVPINCLMPMPGTPLEGNDAGRCLRCSSA